MSSKWRNISAAGLLPVLLCAVAGAQEPKTARLSGLPRDIACAPSSPLTRPTSALKVASGRGDRKTLFGNGDTVVISGGTAQGLRAGDEFYARRVVGDEFTQAVRGGVVPISVHTGGMLQIVETKADVSVGVVTYGCDGIIEGDYLEPFAPEPLPPGTIGSTPDFASPGHVIMGDDRRQMAGAGDFVVIDRGSDHGMRPGQQVTIFRQTLSDGTGPVATIGTAIAYMVQPQRSVARLDRSVDAVYIGDLVAINR
jgi:hypothetical protein